MQEERRWALPEAVEDVLTAVYFERTHTMQEVRQDPDFELATVDYRKWRREQMKKLKIDPLLRAKIQLSNVSVHMNIVAFKFI
jgi:hypothetical protein